MIRILFLFFIMFFVSPVFGQSYEIAETYFKNGDFDKAQSYYEELYKKNPYNHQYLQKLITCYQKTDHLDLALLLLEQKVKERPNDYVNYVELGYVYQLLGETEKAKIKFQKAQQGIVEQPKYGYLIAKAFQERFVLEEALKAYQKTMELQPNANYHMQIAFIYGEMGAIEKMLSAYLDMAGQREDYAKLIQRYIGKFITNDPENENNILFRKLLIQRVQNNPKNAWNILLSWLFVQQEQFQHAFIQERALFQRQVFGPERLLDISDLALEKKDYQTVQLIQEFIIEQVLDQQLQMKAKLQLVELKTLQGVAHNEILAAYEALLQEYGTTPNSIPIQVSYADFLTFQTNNTSKAISVLQQALTLRSSAFDKARIQIKLADIYVFTEKYHKGLLIYAQVQNRLKNHELAQEARFKEARTSYFKGDFDWAQTQLKILKTATSKKISNDAIELSVRIQVHTANDSIPEALQQYAIADRLAYQSRNEQAIAVLSKLIVEAKDHSILEEALFFKAKLLEKTKQYDEAIVLYEEVLALENQSLYKDDALMALGLLYLNQKNDAEEAKTYFEKIIFDYPASIYMVEARKEFRRLRGDVLK